MRSSHKKEDSLVINALFSELVGHYISRLLCVPKQKGLEFQLLPQIFSSFNSVDGILAEFMQGACLLLLTTL